MGNTPQSPARVVGLLTRRLPRVAIATMTKDPEDMGVWLRYHLDKLRFERIYLRVGERTWHLLGTEVLALGQSCRRALEA